MNQSYIRVSDAVSTRAFQLRAVDHYPRLVALSVTPGLPHRERMADYRSLILRLHTEVWPQIGESIKLLGDWRILSLQFLPHRIPLAKQKFKITNRSAYNKAFRQHGSITVWLDESAIAAWTDSAQPEGRSRPLHCTDMAITRVLMMKRVFNFPLRALASLTRFLPDGSAAALTTLRSANGQSAPTSA